MSVARRAAMMPVMLVDRRRKAPAQNFAPVPPAERPQTTAAPILGIDPGLLRTGYAFIAAERTDAPPRLVEAGVIRVQTDGPLEQRLAELEAGLAELLSAQPPRLLACEQLYAHYRHPRTAILMGHARGVILALAARRGIPVIPVAATNVKKLLTGRGHAGKRQMQAAVMAQLRLPRLPEPHDVADAIAIALAGLHQGAARAVLAKPARAVRAKPERALSAGPDRARHRPGRTAAP